MREREKGGNRLILKNRGELFNYRHSQMRNATFGVLKRRFAILSKPLELDIADAISCIYATLAIHNICRSTDGSLGDLFSENDNNNVVVEND